MTDVAIKVENISKRYRIGLKEETKDTFLGALGSILKSPFDNLQKLKKLTMFQNGGGDQNDIIWALKDISFEVKSGEVIGLIGANGAGKSTLLKILAQITHPTSGRVELIGRVASLLEVGTGFHPELTGRENIYLNGTILGMTKKEIDIKLDEIIDFSGVDKFIDTPVKRYSSGMRVRLAFSVAAHLDPEILLIDEVLAVGDAKFQKKCLGKMEDISNQGKTIIFVSHNMDAIQNLCKSCIFINQGSIERIGDTGKLISEYLNETAENSIKSKFINNIKAKNDSVIFKNAQLVDNQGIIIETKIIEKVFSLEMAYEIITDKKIIIPSINIYNNKGRHLLTSFDRDAMEINSSIGNKIVKIDIPTNLFSNGYFKINLLFFSPSFTETERILQTDYILTFKISDEKISEIKSNNNLETPSTLIPQFNWFYE